MKLAKTNANLGFEKELWAVADKLRASGSISAADYRKVVIGLIFLKYVSDTFEWKYDVLVAEGEGFEEEKDAYTMENIFFVPKEARWSYISSKAHTPEIGQVIDDAMRAIEKENKSFKGVLPMNYANSDLDKQTLGEVVDMFTNNINLRDHNEEKDLLGRTYEYFIEQFAAHEGTYAMDNVFFVPMDARWSYISSKAHTPEIGQVIDDAMRAIEKENKSFKGVLPMNYANSDLDKQTLGEVVDMFTNNINLRDHNEEKDLLGRTYEYFIEQFAAHEGKGGGEFYTPTSIVKTIVAVLKPFKGRVYDPACGLCDG